MSRKDQVMKLVKDHRQTIEQMNQRLANINTKLQKQFQDEERHKIQTEYADRLRELNQAIAKHRAELAKDRQTALDPLQGLFNAAMRRAKEMPTGMQAVLDSLEVMPDKTVLELSRKHQDPVLTLKAWKVMQDRELQGDDWKNAQTELNDQAHSFLPKPEIRELAELEQALIHEQLFANDNGKQSSIDKATLARELIEVDKVAEKFKSETVTV
ncbi:MAG: hypothetical protein U5L00_18450 [Desulfovermiculus sp.]|nr:hypothetical protein [Desulfovermiculus sp.]